MSVFLRQPGGGSLRESRLPTFPFRIHLRWIADVPIQNSPVGPICNRKKCSVF